MLIKQTILIIGTENPGKAIACRLASGNYHLLLCDKEFAKADALVKELANTGLACDAEAMECSFDSAWEADIIILALHMSEQKEVAAVIRDVVNQKILISMVLPDLLTTDGISSAASQVDTLQELLPHTSIVAVFMGDQKAEGPGSGKIIPEALITGNDNCAVEIVSSLLGSAGVQSNAV